MINEQEHSSLDSEFGENIAATSPTSLGHRYIYGIRPVEEALRAGTSMEKIYVSFGVGGKAVEDIRRSSRAKAVPCAVMDKRKFAELERTVGDKIVSQGVIALVSASPHITEEQCLELLRKQGNIAVALDEITDPHNLGAIARSAECFGACAVILPVTGSASVTPAAVKVSAGALEHLPVCRVASLSQFISHCADRGVTIVGTAPDGEELSDFSKPDSSIILVIGSEGRGIRPSIRERCGAVLRIPLSGKTQSLNASVSAGIVLYELTK